MRVKIDLRKSSSDILDQIINGIMEINNNGLMIQKLKCNTKTKNMIIARCAREKFDATNDFCTANYIIDDDLESYVIILCGYLDRKLDPGQF